MDLIRRDVAHALRSLAASPGFTWPAVLTLALGIGASTAVFSGVQALLLSPMPWPDPDRLVYLWSTRPASGMLSINTSAADAREWQAASSVIGLGLYSDLSLGVGGGDAEPELLPGLRTSRDLLEVVGVRPALGRGFSPEEDTAGGPPAALISHGLWQRRFGRDPGVLGRQLLVDGLPTPVVGVLPEGFGFPYGDEELWLPLQVAPGDGPRDRRGLRSVARLRPGVPLRAAEAELLAIAARQALEHPDSNGGYGVRLQRVSEDVYPDELRRALYAALGAVLFVLLIGCANVANLLLVRATTRRREIAVRLSLGASRGRVLRQLLVESLVLGALGGGLGLLLAAWGSGLVAAELGPAPRVQRVGLGPAVVGFGVGLSLLTALGFGLVPALQSTRVDIVAALRGGARAGEERRGTRLRRALVAAEVALALVLLVGGGVMMKSVRSLVRVAPGFDSRDVTTLGAVLPGSRYPEAADAWRFFEQVLERAAAIPGVEAAAVVNTLPMDGSNSWLRVEFAGRPAAAPGDEEIVGFMAVSPDYCRALGIPLRRGRGFDRRDTASSTPVVMVNEALAARYWPGGDALGQRLRGLGPDRPWLEVVGVIGDVRHRGHARELRPELYFPFAQWPERFGQIVVRAASGGPEAIRSAVREVDPLQPVSDPRPLAALVAADVARERSLARLLGQLSAASLALALLGIYGVIAYSVRQRSHELGVRMALGATAGRVTRSVVGQALRLSGAGVAAGTLLALGLGRSLEGLVYGVRPDDPAVLGSVALLLLTAAGLAGLLPARRAARIDPAEALRRD